MATLFLEPGGDADFLVGATTGLWGGVTGSPVVATDFVNGGHQKSIKYPVNAINFVNTITLNGRGLTLALGDAGRRISMYIYINALPNATASIWALHTNPGSTDVDAITLRLTSAGVLQLWNATTTQVGTNGATLSTGTWYRISLAYTITSTTVNRFELFKDGVSTISITNATFTTVGTNNLRLGNINGNLTLDFRSSDHYIDNSSSLTDPGNIWVTAKRPNANGTTNGFTTQIGSGGSGYGTGHSPQVNERPLSTTNGWSMIGAGSAITEEYNIEGQSVGDITTVGGTIADYMGWISASSLATESPTMIVNNATTSMTTTSTITVWFQIAGSTSYPAGTGTDIGMTTTTALTTVSLYECGILVAFIPSAVTATTNQLAALGAG